MSTLTLLYSLPSYTHTNTHTDTHTHIYIYANRLKQVKDANPDISHADLYCLAGCVAVEFLGGPKVPFNLGRSDDADGRRCPANVRLPDASKVSRWIVLVILAIGYWIMMCVLS